MTESKLPLPAFLKMLTSNNLPAAKAMIITSKLYKTCNTSSALAELTDFKLQDAGITSAEERKLVLSAVRKAGYKHNSPTKQFAPGQSSNSGSAGPSSSGTSSKVSSPEVSRLSKHNTADAGQHKRKRKRGDERNEFLPDRPPEELEEQAYGSLQFDEVLEETVLLSKHAVVNRAPIMTAWSFIVAERLGFNREEALSIASVYTEMNAVSKGVSIGIYTEDKRNGVEASKGGSQPYVDLMGRRVPLFQTATESWRALSLGTPVSPASGFSYITRSLRQTTPFIIGALRLLANTYTPEQLNQHGFSLYAEFRPEVREWGGRGEVRCEKILKLRKRASAGLNLPQRKPPLVAGEMKDESGASSSAQKVVKYEEDADRVEQSHSQTDEVGEGSPDKKKPRTTTLEEYEAALDEDETFADVDLDFPNPAGGT